MREIARRNGVVLFARASGLLALPAYGAYSESGRSLEDFESLAEALAWLRRVR